MPVAPRKVFDVFVGLLECEARSFGCMVGRFFCEPTKAKVVEVLSLILFVACFCLFFSFVFCASGPVPKSNGNETAIMSESERKRANEKEKTFQIMLSAQGTRVGGGP